MALIKCPECSLSISDKAAACPNCGYPLQPAPEPVEYELTRSNPSESKLGKFLRACVWVDGICLIIWTIVIIAIYTGEAFDWGGYFTTLVTYALYGCLIWCFASLSDDVHNISNALSSLQLQIAHVSIKSFASSGIPSHNNASVNTSRTNTPTSTGHSILLGSYPQGNANDVSSPIKWFVLTTDRNQSLLMSKDILDFKPYDNDNANAFWHHSALRNWLNHDFYNTAFSNKEKHQIIPYRSAHEVLTTDNVFLLSVDEANKLLKNSTYEVSNWWWLRNSDSNVHTVAYVDSEGNIHTGCPNLTMNGGVRPCIWVQNKSLQFPTV